MFFDGTEEPVGIEEVGEPLLALGATGAADGEAAVLLEGEVATVFAHDIRMAGAEEIGDG